MKILKIFIISLFLISAWIATALYLAFEGAWLSPVVEQGNQEEFYDWAVSRIKESNKGTSALVILESGHVVHDFFSGPETDINNDTLFATASFSKFISALAVMSLVEQGKVNLDVPVSRYISRWSLPNSDYDNAGVTVRRLLSHTAGLTDGLGFGDYRGDEELPDVVSSLNHPRASTEAVQIKVGKEPGSEFIYSGGGYLILELLVEEVTGQGYSDYVRETLLDPLAMLRSTYAYPVSLDNVSPAYNEDGSPAPTYQYASKAATAFASSASDLTLLARALIDNKPDLPVSKETLSVMRSAHGVVMGAGIWGLGTMLYSRTPAGDFVYGHDGANEPAINVSLRINPDNSDAIIVLVSGHPSLASEIGSEWTLWQTGYPDFLSTEAALMSALVPVLVGILFIILLLVFIFRSRN